MLHITNGHSAGALISKARIGGYVLPWRDVLHEGAVRGGLTLDELSEERAEFIAACGWGAEREVRAEFRSRDERLKRSVDDGEVVLWFEHDLYDQLQLIQLLDWFTGADLSKTELTLICIDGYEGVADFHGLGQLNAEQVSELFPTRREVTPEQFALARKSWAAFRADDPRGVESVLAGDTTALPFLRGALMRHLQQFPSSINGLSRTESNILRALDADGAYNLTRLFDESQAREEARFLGDATFIKLYLEPLCRCAVPLVRMNSGNVQREFVDESSSDEAAYFYKMEAFANSTFEITDAGREVLRGGADHIELNSIDCWRGGVRLHEAPTWRWHEAERRLISLVV